MTDHSMSEGSRAGLVLALVVAALIIAIFSMTGRAMPFAGELSEPDSYLRALRVMTLIDEGRWFDVTVHGIGETGLQNHWTRAVDLMVALGAWPLSFFAESSQQAILWWSSVLIPGLFLLAVWSLWWGLGPVFDERRRLLACLLIPAHFTIVARFLPGAIDHHGAIILMGFVMIGVVVRLFYSEEDYGGVWPAALAGAFALWISPEAFVFVVGVSAALGLAWVLRAKLLRQRLQAFLAYSWLLAFVSAAFCLADRGSLMNTDIDQISGLYVGLFFAQAAFWTLAFTWHRLQDLNSRRGSSAGDILLRGIFATAAAVSVAWALVTLHPTLAAGAINDVDPLYQATRIRFINELGSFFHWKRLLRGDLGELWSAFGWAPSLFIALPALACCIARRDRALWLWVYLAAVIVAFMTISSFPYKMASLYAIFSIPVVADLLCRLADFYQTGVREQEVRRLAFGVGQIKKEDVEVAMEAGARPARYLLTATTLMLLVFLPIISLASNSTAPAETKKDQGATVSLPDPFLTSMAIPEVTVGRSCRLSKVTNALPADGQASIMAFSDYGPEFLFRGAGKIYSVPNHRYQPGFELTYRVFNAPRDEEAAKLLAEAGTDFIYICHMPAQDPFMGFSRKKDGFVGRITAGHIPSWLEVVAPDNRDEAFRLFRVDHQSLTAILADEARRTRDAGKSAVQRLENNDNSGMTAPAAVTHTAVPETRPAAADLERLSRGQAAAATPLAPLLGDSDRRRLPVSSPAISLRSPLPFSAAPEAPGDPPRLRAPLEDTVLPAADMTPPRQTWRRPEIKDFRP